MPPRDDRMPEASAQMTSDRHGEQRQISRRRFVAGTLVAGASAAAPASARVARPARRTASKGAPVPSSADVVVIGAGFAGLTAAHTLSQAGRPVVVLEARDRVGGRVWNHDLGGGHVSERGGTFVGPTQDRVMALARELAWGRSRSTTGATTYMSPTARG